MDDKKALMRFYRWNAPVYDLTRWAVLRGRRAAVEAMELSNGDAVLEIGCGTGWNFAEIEQRIGPQGTLVGLDLSLDMLHRSQRRMYTNTHLIQADAGRLLLQWQFDAILAAYSLSMVPDWQSAIRCACDHLKEGGRIVILDFGSVPQGLRPLRRLLDQYLAWCHVETSRDLAGVLRSQVSEVEELRPVTAYAQLLRGRV